MCGISGIIDKRDRPVEHAAIKRLTDLVIHRGPDGEGYFFGANFALGHRRLAIMDLSHYGDQPMAYGGRYHIVYNGEIYNYLELRTELEALGHVFASASDTEVILAAYAQWGAGCCARFNGMWAFALYDAAEQVVFFARDRYGEKPLYYFSSSDRFVFGSEIKQLLAALPSNRANRRVVVESLLTSIEGYGPDTFFEDVKAFPQAHYGVYDLRRHTFVIKRYYSLTIDEEVRRLSPQAAQERFRELLEDAVRIRLRSDVRIGACLSGGLDSSSTAALASRMYGADRSEPFVGIHARSSDAESDESAYARSVAERVGLKLHIVEPRTEDFFANLDELIDTHEEPFGGPSMFMGWHVFQRAKTLGCKVMLSGQGADEVLLGYERYFATSLRATPLRRVLPEVFAQARNSSLSLAEVLLYNFYFTHPALRISRLKQRSLLRREVKDGYDFDIVQKSVESFRCPDELQLLEICAVQLPRLLRYEDRNSMRHSVEARLPFLDHRLVQFCVSLPSQLKIRDGWTKYILRRAMDSDLPAEVTWRRGKIGFGAPERTWLGSARENMLSEIAGSSILSQIAEHKRLLRSFDSLNMTRRWWYYMIAAWERRMRIAW